MASAVGARILREGGNAIDAAVGTSLALSVTFPQAGNLGGGGFLLYSPVGGPARFLDYRETAPRNIRPELFLHNGTRDEIRSTRGGLPVGTPGTVAGLAAALEQYGTWPWERVVAPSVELARRGVWLTTRQARYIELYEMVFRDFPSSARIFLPEGRAPLPGTLFQQPELALTLERLAREGPRSFYEGPIARQIVTAVQAEGGVLDETDLAEYRPVWREPLSRSFLGRRVVAPSLPSGGGMVLLACLGLFEAEGFGETKPQSLERYLAYAQVMEVAFRLRGALLGDPAHVAPATLAAAREVAERPFKPGDLARLRRDLDGDAPMRLGNEQNTTHLCVIDPKGNAVSNTYSLNTIFGSKLVVDGAGFFLNNSLDDFSLADGAPNWYELVDGRENRLAPGKRPVSSMSPALFLREDSPNPNAPAVELILGGSGGPRIPTLMFQIAQGVLGDAQLLDEAVRQPRVHHQHLPSELAVEQAMSGAMRDSLQAVLETRGEALAETPMLGIAAALRVDHEAEDAPLSAILDSRFTLV
jgi:gamma-glutamyltranspeptidase/glutathione hydrolase